MIEDNNAQNRSDKIKCGQSPVYVLQYLDHQLIVKEK